MKVFRGVVQQYSEFFNRKNFCREYPFTLNVSIGTVLEAEKQTIVEMKGFGFVLRNLTGKQIG